MSLISPVLVQSMQALSSSSSSNHSNSPPATELGSALFQDGGSRVLQSLGIDPYGAPASSAFASVSMEQHHVPNNLPSSSAAIARNSTKTMKCPMCNWHYKYKEALENHIKDKHPEKEITCAHCINNLPHPKLGRGETYPCGYKPFRCAICNYSTTTKGNLSIHMQSDKHLHAVQDIPTTMGNFSVAPSPGLPTVEPGDDKPFQCLICGTFTTDLLEELFDHLNVDRSQTHAADINALHGAFHCLLCPYYTTLKANFQLHMRTDKHIQRVQLINHMRESPLLVNTPTSALNCRVSSVKSGIQVRCRPCAELLTSSTAIRDHCQSALHQTRTSLMQNSPCAVAAVAAALGLRGPDEGTAADRAMDLSRDAFGAPETPNAECESTYECRKCDFVTGEESHAIGHLEKHSLNDTETEPSNAPVSCLQLIPESNEEIAVLVEMNDARIKCDQCDFLAVSAEELQSHTDSSHSSRAVVPEDGGGGGSVGAERACPLCELPLPDTELHGHLLDEHKIASDVATKLMTTTAAEPVVASRTPLAGCGHASHPASPVYRFPCSVCPMVFRSREAFQKHALRHLFECTHKCTRCSRAFKNQISLKNHLATKHGLQNVENLADSHCSICNLTFPDRVSLHSHVTTVDHLQRAKKFLEEQNKGHLGNQISDQVLSLLSQFPKPNSVSDPKKPYRCNVCRLSYGQGSTLDIHLRSVAHQNRIGRLAELLALGEVDAHLPVSEQPGGVPQKTIGELVLPQTNNELEKLKGSNSPMDVALATAASLARKRKFDDDTNPIAAFQNFMNMSQLLQFSADNAENGGPGELGNALAAFGKLGSVDLQGLLNSKQSSACPSPSDSPRASPSAEPSELPKTGRALRRSLEHFGLELVQQFFENVHTVRSDIERLDEEAVTEVCRVDCPNCGVVFPSIWVLKGHVEDAHTCSLPLEAVQQFSEKLKRALAELEDEDAPLLKRVKKEEPCGDASGTSNSLLNGFAAAAAAAASRKGNDVPASSPSSTAEPTTSVPNLAMMQMMAAGGFPMLMNPFLSVMNPDVMAPSMFVNGVLGNAASSLPNGASASDLAAVALGQQRRARTKITDDQLKVLKQYFDISNSPTEQQVKEMSVKTGLAEKVIKHWFRNTLFKERQRDKDSPYNFNVPPQLSIDLDTYEKTGEAKIKSVASGNLVASAVMPEALLDDVSNQSVASSAVVTPTSIVPLEGAKVSSSKVGLTPTTIKSEPKDASASLAAEFMANLNKVVNNNFVNPFTLLSQAALNDASNPLSSMLGVAAGAGSGALTESACTSSGSNASGSQNGASGRRANRTRFTDVQLRTLQQFFDKQAYPKDDDLEMLSRKLNLSPRVIVVWFQNARQKARKIYENTPNQDNNERFVRTPGQNFQCNRCHQVFPRYYELIQHQQRVCYPGEQDGAHANESGALGEEGNSNGAITDEEKPTTSYDLSSTATATVTPGAPLALGDQAVPPAASPSSNQSTMEKLAKMFQGSSSGMTLQPSDSEDPAIADEGPSDLLRLLRNGTPDAFAKLFSPKEEVSCAESGGGVRKEESTPLDLSASVRHSPDGPDSAGVSYDSETDFARMMSVSPNLTSMLAGSLFGMNGLAGSPSNTQRSPSATNVHGSSGGSGGGNNKRYRTHLTPLQVFVMRALFNDYKTPSMTECDLLGGEIGLNKRVVQVWFQNARAKERKCRSVTNDDEFPRTAADRCDLCGTEFGRNGLSATTQDHIFTSEHIKKLSELFGQRNAANGVGGAFARTEPSSSPPNNHNAVGEERPRARAVRDNGVRRSQSRPTSAVPSSVSYNMMYGLQGMNLPNMLPEVTASLLGTPVAALQIPPAVMQQIAADLQAGKEMTEFTQDGLTWEDLRNKVSEEEFRASRTVTTEVGYACPGCANSFQQYAVLEAHQRLMCSGAAGRVLKLMQIQYECTLCSNRHGTQDDFKKHLDSAAHRVQSA